MDRRPGASLTTVGAGPVFACPPSRTSSCGLVGSSRKAASGDRRRDGHQQPESSSLEEAVLENGFGRLGERCTAAWPCANHHTSQSAGGGLENHAGETLQ